jgi:hypothetical protein
VTALASSKPGDPARQLLFVTTPALWPAWPFLPVVRRARGAEELGVMFDARAVCGWTGFGSTVFKMNLFALPPTVDALLALPREVFDSSEELLANGWVVD